MATRYVDIDPATIGYDDDPEYIGYRFQQVINGDGRRRIDGVELEYSQQMVFLPKFWRGLSAFGSVSRTKANAEILDHVPKSANGGIRFSNHKFNAQIRCTWVAGSLDFRDDPQGEEVWRYERIMFDFSGGYKINRTYEITLTGRNILNSPIARYSNVTSHLSSHAVFGPAWTLGVRGRF
jgi:outer membrane receptor protein involved in Fe transport